MHPYPKQIYSLQQQIKSYVDAGMIIEDSDSAEDVLTRVGYYRLRGYCFHLYNNRTINTAPEILAIDRVVPQPKFNGLYQQMLAMKYLRPNDQSWVAFLAQFKQLMTKYGDVIELDRINFPVDWETHFTV